MNDNSAAIVDDDCFWAFFFVFVAFGRSWQLFRSWQLVVVFLVSRILASVCKKNDGLGRIRTGDLRRVKATS